MKIEKRLLFGGSALLVAMALNLYHIAGNYGLDGISLCIH